MRVFLLVLVLALAGCAGSSTPSGTPVKHDGEFDMIPLDSEAPYVHVLGVNSTNISLHIGGLPSAGDVAMGPDGGVKVLTRDGNSIRLELESRESLTATSQLTPVWVLALHDVPPGKYTLHVKLSKAACGGGGDCTTKKSLEASTDLDVPA